jgi:hypothetical protein
MAEQQYIQLPDNSYFPIKKGESEMDALQAAMSKYPDAFKTEARKEVKDEHEHGLLAALGSGFRGGLGSTAKGIGELTGLEGLAAFGKRQQEKAGEKYAPTSEADIEEASKRGLLPELGAYASKYVTEPVGEAVGNIAGRYGLPTAAGAGAALAAPELGFASALGFAATNAPIHIGEAISAQKEAGQAPDPVRAVATGLTQAAIDSLAGFVFAKPMQGILGKTAAEQARALAPEVVAGRITVEDASKQINGTLKSFLQGTAQNAVVGTGMMLGNEVVGRAGLGEDVTSPEAMEAYGHAVKTGVGLSPFFGALHGLGTRREAGRVLAGAEQGRQARVGLEAQQQQLLDEQNAAKQAQEQARLEAEETKRKQSPEYALEIGQKYDDAYAKLNEMKAALVKPGRGADPATIAQYKDDIQAIKKYEEEVLTPLIPDYNRTRALRKSIMDERSADAARAKIDAENQERERQDRIEREAAAMPQESQTMPFYESRQRTLPGIEAVEQPEPVPDQEAEAKRLAVHKRNLAMHLDELQRLKDEHQAQENEFVQSGDIESYRAFKAQRRAIEERYKQTQEELDKLGGYHPKEEPHPTTLAQEEYNKAVAKWQKASGAGSPAYDPAKAERLFPAVEAADAKLQAAIKKYGYEHENQKQLGFDFGPESEFKSQYSEPKEAFAARSYKPGSPEAEAQEQAYVEDARRRDEEEIANAERERKIAPELNALKRISKAPYEEPLSPGRLKSINQQTAEQFNLFPETREGAVSEKAAKNTKLEDRLYRQLERALGEDPNNWTTEQRALLERVADNINVIENNPKLMEDISDWLYRADHRKSVEKLTSPEGITRYVPREDARAKGITAELDRLEQGKRSETEGGKTAVQGELNLGFPSEGKGKVFATPKEFQDYMAGEALNDVRRSMGLVNQTMARLTKRAAPLQAKAEKLSKEVNNLQEKYDKLVATKGEETVEANKMLTEAKNRQKELTNRLDDELKDLQVAYLQAQQELEFAVKTSHDISKNFAANKQSALANDVVTAKEELLKLLKTFKENRPVPARGSISSTRVETNKQINGIRTAFDNVLKATRALRDFENKLSKNPVKFLDEDLNYQLQLKDELNRMGTLHHNLSAAKFDLDMAAEKQQRSRKNKAEAKAVSGDVAAAEKLVAETEAANKQRDVEAKEIAEQIYNLDMQRRNIERIVEGNIGKAKAVAAERLPGEPLKETQIERELKDGIARAKEQAKLERGESVVKEGISFEPRRELEERMNISPVYMEALDHTIKDADSIIKHIESLNVKREAELKEINARQANTRDPNAKGIIEEKEVKPRVEGIAKSLEDLDKVRKIKKDLEAEIENKKEDYDAYTALQSNDPEVVAAAKQKIVKRLAKVKENIANVEERMKEPDMSDSTRKSRTESLKRYRKEAGDLQLMIKTGFGVRRQEVGGKREMLKTEPIVPGERLGARKVGPVVRPMITAGNIRTGTKTTGERTLSTRSPISQAGEKKTLTVTQAIREANKDIQKGLFSGPRFLEAYDRLTDLEQKNNAALEKAREENNQEKINKYEGYAKRIEKELAKLDLAEEPEDYEAGTLPSDLVEENKEAKWQARYRTVTKGGESLKLDTIEKLVNTLTKDWKNVPDIEIVQSEKDLPDNIKEQMIRDKKQGQVPGVYDPNTKKVFLVADNLKEPNDVVMTIAHEVAGHYGLEGIFGADHQRMMDRLYEGNKNIRETVDARMEKEPNLTRALAVEETLADMAENPNIYSMGTLKKIFYAVKQWFAQKLGITHISDREVEQIISNARRFVRKGIGGAGGESGVRSFLFRTVPEYGQENALTNFANKVIAQPKSIKEKLGVGNHGWLQAEMNNVDMRAGLREGLREGARATGDNRSYEQAMYNVTKADQKSAFTRAVLTNGAPTMYIDSAGFHGVTTKGGVNYFDIMKPISEVPNGNAKGKMNQASAYLIAQRAQNKGLSALDLGALGVTEQELKDVMKAVNADPALKAALEKTRKLYNQYNENLINWLASTGAISKGAAKELLKDGDYVPYYRIKENGAADLVFSDKVHINIGDIRHQPYLAELKGGETKILPLDESIQRNTTLLVDKGLTNLATKSVAYAMQSFGKGHGQVNSVTGTRENLMPIHKGYGPADPNVIRFNQEPDPLDKSDDGKRWLKVKTNDTVLGGIPAELVVKSLEGAHLTLPAFLKMGGMFSDVLRSGITRTPLYPLRQLIKDPMAMAFTGGLDYNPLTAVYKAGKEFIAMNRGDSKTAAALIEKGLIQSGIFTGDQSDLSKFALQLASGKDASAIDKLFAFTDRIAMRADSATRVLVYENALKNGLSEVQADQATMESMNYYKRGLSPTVQYANRLIPFFNSQIQGLNVLYKAARGQMPYTEQLKIKEKFMNNAMLLMGMGLVYGAAMQDDEYYKNAKPKDRYTNFFVHLPGVDEPLKVPLPYEAGWFFSASVAAVDAMMGSVDTKQQMTALKDMFVGAIPGSSSMFTPQMVKPMLEVWTNKDFYTGDNIESASMQRKTPEERYNTATSELAKSLGKAIPLLSPIQLEHIVKGYLGSMPIAAAKAANGLFKAEATGEAPTTRASEAPLVGGLFQRKYGGAETDVVYGLAKEATAASDTYKDMLRQGRREEAREYMQAHLPEIASANAGRKYENVMGALRRRAEVVRADPKLTAEEKRTKLDDLDALKQRETKLFMEAIRGAEERAKSRSTRQASPA